MSQLNRLKSAIEFFDSNKNQSQKKENEQLWIQGRQNVDRDFDQLLNKCSEATLSFLEKDSDTESSQILIDSNSLNFKENDLSQMISIIDWFKQVEPAYLDKLYEKLMKSRNQLMLDRLKKIKDNRSNTFKTSNLASSGLSALNANQAIRRNSGMNQTNSNASLLSLAADEKKSTIRSRLTENIISSTNDLRRKKSTNATISELAANNSNSLNRQSNQYVIEQDFETIDCVKFVLCARESLRMFSIENIFISKIIDCKDKVVLCKILERIFDPVLRFLKTDSERLTINMRQITSKLTSKYVIAMFTSLSDLVKMKSQFLQVFEQSILITKTARHISNSIEQFLEMFITIERACVNTLNDVIEEVKNDPKTIQPNGNIHSITTETISFVLNLLQFDTIAGLLSNVVLKENISQAQLLPSEVEIKLRRESCIANEQKFTQIAYLINSEEDKKNCRIALANFYGWFIFFVFKTRHLS